jgi:hypothetical protein
LNVWYEQLAKTKTEMMPREFNSMIHVPSPSNSFPLQIETSKDPKEQHGYLFWSDFLELVTQSRETAWECMETSDNSMARLQVLKCHLDVFKHDL